MSKSDAATAGELQENWIAELISDRNRSQLEARVLLESAERKTLELAALRATLSEREAEIERLREQRDHAQATAVGIAFDKGTLLDKLATARKEALEEAAKVCETIAAGLDNEWNRNLGKADDMCGALADAAEDIRALSTTSPTETKREREEG